MSDVVALVPDLMDRSRLSSALDQPVAFVGSVDDVPSDAAVVIVDLARGVDLDALRRVVPDGRIIAFGPHVDGAALEGARAAGIAEVLPRSRFFRDVADLLG